VVFAKELQRKARTPTERNRTNHGIDRNKIVSESTDIARLPIFWYEYATIIRLD